MDDRRNTAESNVIRAILGCILHLLENTRISEHVIFSSFTTLVKRNTKLKLN